MCAQLETGRACEPGILDVADDQSRGTRFVCVCRRVHFGAWGSKPLFCAVLCVMLCNAVLCCRATLVAS